MAKSETTLKPSFFQEFAFEMNTGISIYLRLTFLEIKFLSHYFYTSVAMLKIQLFANLFNNAFRNNESAATTSFALPFCPYCSHIYLTGYASVKLTFESVC
jgi:hypothetical protein